jgi:hypothetical protein
MSILHGNLPCAQNFFRLKSNFRKKQGITLQRNSSVSSNEGRAKIATPKIMKTLSVNSPHGSRDASPNSQKSGGLDDRMKEEINKGSLGLGVR